MRRSSPKGTTQSLKFAPNSQTSTSMMLYCCLLHPPSLPFFFLIRLKFHLILTTKRLSALVYTLFSSSSSFSYSSINLNSLPSHFPPTPPSSLSYSYPWRFKTSNKFNLSLVPLANTLNPLFYATLPSLPSTPLPLPPCRLWLSGRGAGDRQARQRRVWRRR